MMLPQIQGLITSRLSIQADPAMIVLVFFAYSFFGYVMECVVLTIEKKQLIINRGFSSHLPFCIIYGFGAMIGYALLSPVKDNLVLLFVVGAVAATGFEYIVGRMQILLFGDFWWDYSKKPFNYKGILCLESTIGWGIVALVIIRVIHKNLVWVVSRVPFEIANFVAVVLVLAYAADFAHSAYAARQRQKEQRDLAWQEEQTEY